MAFYRFTSAGRKCDRIVIVEKRHARNTRGTSVSRYTCVKCELEQPNRHVTISFHVARPAGMLARMQRTRLLRNTTFIRVVCDEARALETGKLQSFKLTNESLFVFSEQRRGCNFVCETRPGEDRRSISHRRRNVNFVGNTCRHAFAKPLGCSSCPSLPDQVACLESSSLCRDHLEGS